MHVHCLSRHSRLVYEENAVGEVLLDVSMGRVQDVNLLSHRYVLGALRLCVWCVNGAVVAAIVGARSE